MATAGKNTYKRMIFQLLDEYNCYRETTYEEIKQSINNQIFRIMVNEEMPNWAKRLTEQVEKMNEKLEESEKEGPKQSSPEMKKEDPKEAFSELRKKIDNEKRENQDGDK